MKIRTGFVANSSSSSFIIFGEEYYSFKDIKDSKDLWCYIYGYTEDSGDFFQVDEKMFAFMKNNPEFMKQICHFPVFRLWHTRPKYH